MVQVEGMDSARLLQEKWQHGFCPIVNGIVFGDGRIVFIDLIQSTVPDARGEVLAIVEWSSLGEFLKERPDFWVSLSGHCEVLLAGGTHRVTAGGGGMGGDGFVALSHFPSNQLQWILFLEDSNPFVQVAVVSGVIQAATTLGDTWSIPIDQPTHGSVVRRPNGRC